MKLVGILFIDGTVVCPLYVFSTFTINQLTMNTLTSWTFYPVLLVIVPAFYVSTVFITVA